MVDRKKLRNQSQQQNLKKYIDNQNDVQSDQVTRLGERDLDTGKDAVIYPNNNDVIAGQRVFNASLPIGAPVQATQPYGNALVALNQRSYFEDDDVVEEDVVEVYPFKVLFSITDYVTNTVKYYLGGDRQVPLLIDEFDKNQIYVNESYIVNSGKNKNNWIVTFKYYDYLVQKNVIKTYGSVKGEIVTEYDINYLEYRGGALWTSLVITPLIETVLTIDENSFSSGGIFNKQGYYQLYDGTPNLFNVSGTINEYGNANIFCSYNNPDYPENGYYTGTITGNKKYTNNNVNFLVYGSESKHVTGLETVEETYTNTGTCESEKSVNNDQLTRDGFVYLTKNFTESLNFASSSNNNSFNSYTGESSSVLTTSQNELTPFLVLTDSLAVVSISGRYSNQHTYNYNSSSGGTNTRNIYNYVQFYLNKTNSQKIEINNSPTFIFELPYKLVITENLTELILDNVFLNIPINIIKTITTTNEPYTNNEIYESSGFNFIGTPVIVSQFIDYESSKSWLVTGTILLETVLFSSESSKVISGFAISVTKVEKVPFNINSSHNGTVASANGSFFEIIQTNTYSNIIHSRRVNNIQSFQRGHKYVNFIKEKVYISRDPYQFFDKPGENYAEEHSLKPNTATGKLDVVKTNLKKGKVYSLGAPEDYAFDENKNYRIEGVSYYPA